MKYRLICATSVFCICAAFAPHAGAGGRKNAPVLPKHPSARVRSLSGYSKEQVDGILDKVTDSLQEKTDYYWHRGDYPRIVDLDRITVEIDPGDMDPYSTGGWLMESMGDLKGAESFYKLGVERNRESSYLYYQLAAFYYNTLKNYKKAVKVSELGVRKNDADVNDWRMLAHGYEKAGMLGDALKTWKTIKAKYPGATAVDFNLSRVQRLVSEKNSAGKRGALKTKDDNPVLNL